MSDPKRWLDDSGELGEDERRALRAGLEDEPRRESAVRGEAKRAVWGALVAKLPAAAATATGGGAAATGGSAGGAGATASGVAAGGATVAAGSALGTLLKPLAIGLALGTATAGGVAVTYHSVSPSPSPATPAAVSAPAPAIVPSPDLPRVDNAVNPARPPEPAPLEAPEAPTALRAPASAPSEAATTPLGSDSTGPSGPSQAAFPSEAAASVVDLAESRRIARARSLLRSSNARGALAELEAVRRDFPNGTLAQEREALSIEALRALGEKANARERARAFLVRYPNSPHAAVVRRALE